MVYPPLERAATSKESKWTINMSVQSWTVSVIRIYCGSSFKANDDCGCLQEIAKAPVRLSHLRRVMPKCSKKVLIDTLRGLEELGWVERREYPTKVRRVDYSLKPTCEQDVRRAISIASREAAAIPPNGDR
jgi:hypothetical protein